VTWTELALLCLVGERGFAMGVGFYRGARAAWRAGQEPVVGHIPVTYTEVPAFVEVASDDVMALDYSANLKRH
jgi:hypothetical protein